MVAICAAIVFSILLGLQKCVFSRSLVKTAGPNESKGWRYQSEKRQVNFFRICGRQDEMTAKANALTPSFPRLLAVRS